MATRKISNIRLLQILKDLNKSYFTVADLEKVLGLDRNSLYVLLNRLVKNGSLVRLKRDVYQSEFQSLQLGKVANELYYPSYLSFESALSRYGILSQTPYVLTFATTKTSKRLKLAGREVEYRQLKNKFFFGYTLEKGVYIAEPEKALLDQLYMMSKGRGELSIEELDLKRINKKLLEKYSRNFPDYTKKLVDRAGKFIGTTPITDERKERIV